MAAASPSPTPLNDLAWVDSSRFEDVERARAHLSRIWQCGATAEVLVAFQKQLTDRLTQIDDRDQTAEHLSGFVLAHEQPEQLLHNFVGDPRMLPTLLQLFSTSSSVAKRLIGDPESFHRLRRSEHGPISPGQRVQELAGELAGVDQPAQASSVLQQYYSREILRVIHSEFVDAAPPEQVGRRISETADVVVEAALQHTLNRLADRRGMPQRADGTTPEVSVIGLGNYGGQELGYAAPLKMIFIYDSIDNLNTWHRDFYNTVVAELCRMFGHETPRFSSLHLDLREGPRYEVGVQICSFREAVRIYETAGRIWQRLGFVKARVVAGSETLGKTFLGRLEPWVYRQYISRVELAEIRTLRHKLEKRAESLGVNTDVSRAPGGRDDLELTVQFLQLLHGGNLPSVRCHNTHEAIVSLERAGCITHPEATLLCENYARLCRLQHQLSVMFDRGGMQLPEDETLRRRLAWQLGIRKTDGTEGDLEKFHSVLDDTFSKNRRIINHLMLDAPGDGDDIAVETELLLDPDPDPGLVESTMKAHGLGDAGRAMQDLRTLSTESVAFLSPHRCRHFFAAIAPALLDEVERTPDPAFALASLVNVTDSLGAKATLWELLGSSRPTMELMVRLCAATPYLSSILTNNPGMIDELIDSLLMNRLPSAQRLDARSIELSRGAADIGVILHSFKNGAHLNIGVRDMLGKETLEATHQAIGDTAEACLRRLIDHEHETLARQFGDPGEVDGDPAQLVTIALGKLGGREPNYHSTLDALFLYTGDGETQRRVGGHRSTLTHHQFFNQLVRHVIDRIHHAGPKGRLYELDLRLGQTGEEGRLATTVDTFLRRFHDGTAPLWERLALCKARTISGDRLVRKTTDEAIAKVIRDTEWSHEMAIEIRQMRRRTQQTARSENLKRGEGGTTDVDYVAQMLMLRHAGDAPSVIRPGSTAALSALAEAGHLDEGVAMTLINGYRTLRRIEANLRLMNTPARHELPDGDEPMKNLAFLMGEKDTEMIVAQCMQARKRIRQAFDDVFDEASRSP